MWKRPKYLWNLHESAFVIFFILVIEVDLENVSPSVRLNLSGVCSQIDCRWRGSCSRLWDFATPNSNAIISKTKIFYSIFCYISGIYIKFETFWKKGSFPWLGYFRNKRLWKSSLDHCLKSAVVGNSLTVNIWKRSKYMQNLHGSAFVMFFHHYQGSWFGKCLP